LKPGKKGAKHIDETAKEQVEHILDKHVPTPFADDAKKEILQILKKAETELLA